MTMPTFGQPAATPLPVPAHDDVDEGLYVEGRDDAPDADSALAMLQAEITAKTATTTRIPVKGRPGWELDVDLTFDGKRIAHWRRQAKLKGTDELDSTTFSALLLGQQTVAILRQGSPVVLDGVPQTFTTPQLRELLTGATVRDRVVQLFGLAGQVDSAATRVMVEAGYGDATDAVEDPTT